MSNAYPASAQARLKKSARLVLLLELDRAGLLARRSNRQMADAFGPDLHRSTRLRDTCTGRKCRCLRQFDDLKGEASRLRAQRAQLDRQRLAR